MDDEDIDIEEHDVFDHPTIRNIFPDITALKEEISFSDEEPTNKPEFGIVTVDETTVGTAEDCNFQNNIVRQPFMDLTLPDSQEPPVLPIFRNKIILGSRPRQKQKSISEDDHYETKEKPFLAKVRLKDIGSYLNSCDKFCKLCQILFRNNMNLDTHNKKYHNFTSNREVIREKYPSTSAISRKRYKCNKCSQSFTIKTNLQRHLKAIHKLKFQQTKLKHKGDSNVKTTISAKCFHCKKSFPTQKDLIEHIYTVLTSSNMNNAKQIKLLEEQKKIIKFSTIHLRNQKGENLNNVLTKTEPSQKNTEIIKNSLLFRCYYCSYYLKNEKLYESHLINKHKDTTFIKAKRVHFEPNCKFCPAKLTASMYYNIHLHKKHREKIEEIVKIKPNICIPKVELALAMKSNKEFENKSLTHQNIFNIQIEDHGQIDKNIVKPNTIPNKEDAVLKNGNRRNTKAHRNTANKVQKNKVVKKKKTLRKKLNQKNGIGKCINNVDNHPIEDIGNLCTKTLVLKAVLFKCLRCDIHFLSAKTALSHLDHMEMLINWKCEICERIFKKHDEHFHRAQHAFTKKLKVYLLKESELKMVLYNCTKCAIHFNDDNYLSHFEECGDNISESIYCTICDILVEKSISDIHKSLHESRTGSVTNFTFIDSDAILFDASGKPVQNKAKNKYFLKDKFFLKMCFCETCKCFVNYTFLRSVHVRGRCKHMEKKVCKDCGMVLTKQSMTSHRKRHKMQPNLKLQNFTIWNLEGTKRILPPIPTYPKCSYCSIYFLSKAAILNHVCKDYDFLTCPVCNIKLCKDIFKLHVGFHYYLFKGKKKQLKCNLQILERSEETLVRSIEEQDKVKPDTSNEECVYEVVSKNKDSFVGSTTTPTSDAVCLAHCERIPKQIATTNNNKKISHNLIVAQSTKSDLELFNILYSCIYCYIITDSFDKAVEHCQEHYYIDNSYSYAETCGICKHKFDKRFLKDHDILHNTPKLKDKEYKLLNFDAFYFGANYELWKKKLFEGLESKIVETILERSIYRHEGRVKLNIIQKGSSKVTVYKCSSCCYYVDPNTLINHAENSCFRSRRHPCSVCGLPYISHVSRMDHENIHKQYPDVGFKSYRIVVFNQESDLTYNSKIINWRQNFIVFVCRKCGIIFERFQSKDHQCHEDIKKCNVCEFLINKGDFDQHTSKHLLIDNYTPNNMKVILFGTNCEINSYSCYLPLALNSVVDHAFYKCKRCGVCIKRTSVMVSSNHDCGNENATTKCYKCGIYLLKKHYALHFKRHDTDPYFVQENFNIILNNITHEAPLKLSRLSTLNKKCYTYRSPNVTATVEIEGTPIGKVVPIEKKMLINNELPNGKDCKLIDNKPIDDSHHPNIILEKVAKVYKCRSCGLHFLDKMNIKAHLGHCSTKTSKQKCSKCSIIFTPKELFTHLIRHHGDKKNHYKLDVIEMSESKNEFVVLYKCSECNLHFVDCERAKQHTTCYIPTLSDKIECKLCKLFFENSEIGVHREKHHNDNVAEIETINIKELHDANTSQDQSVQIQDLVANADAVTEIDYNISDETLSQVNFKSYSKLIFKCEKCDIHYLTESTFRSHVFGSKHEKLPSKQNICSICGLNFSLQSLTKHIYIHHEKMNLKSSDYEIKTENNY